MTNALPKNRALSTNFACFRHFSFSAIEDPRISIYTTITAKIQAFKVFPREIPLRRL